MKWADCMCGKWCETPREFDDRKHFVKCTCGKIMYLSCTDPKDLAYKDTNKIVGKVVNQKDVKH